MYILSFTCISFSGCTICIELYMQLYANGDFREEKKTETNPFQEYVQDNGIEAKFYFMFNM